MQAIQIKYMSATNNRGARLKAWTSAMSTTEARDYSKDAEEQASSLAACLAEKMGWVVELSKIHTLPNGEWVVVEKQK